MYADDTNFFLHWLQRQHNKNWQRYPHSHQERNDWVEYIEMQPMLFHKHCVEQYDLIQIYFPGDIKKHELG
jgi:hypothetical protein